MRIDFSGKLIDEPEIRVGYIGCGGHSFRNVLPTFQFAPVELVATCDIQYDRAQAYARKFGAQRAYQDYREMLEKEKLDAVFIVMGYNQFGRPMYAPIALDCLNAGCHVWMEKPGVGDTQEVELLQQTSIKQGKTLMIGYKNMFTPVNKKAKALITESSFGEPSMSIQEKSYLIPSMEDFSRHVNQHEMVSAVVDFTDHLCHPMSTLVMLFGSPISLYYTTNSVKSGIATFTFANGLISSIVFTHPAPTNGGDERTVIISNSGNQIVIENNIRIKLNGRMKLGDYGNVPDYFISPSEEAGKYWEPEFCRGQLFSKGLFLAGFYDEVNDFARSILEHRPISNGTLKQAKVIATVSEAFHQGPEKRIDLIY